MIAPRHRALFAECASPDAIAPELKKAQAALRAAERTVAWLTDLLAERNAQIAAGTWPPAAPRRPEGHPVTETIHACPPGLSGVTPCCGRTPFELPRTDRMTVDPQAVTCTDAPTPGLTQCPTCGPKPTEPHPRQPGARCANCKTHATAVCSGEEGFCAVHGYDRHPTAPDGLREQYMAAIIRGGGCVDLAAATDAVLAVRDEELLRLRAETATADQIRADVQRERDQMAAMLVDLRANLTHEQEQRDDLRRRLKDTSDACNDATTSIYEVRKLTERWENALTPDRPYARALRAALDKPSDGAGADTARHCGSTLPHPSHKFMRLHVIFNCPGVTPKEPS